MAGTVGCRAIARHGVGGGGCGAHLMPRHIHGHPADPPYRLSYSRAPSRTPSGIGLLALHSQWHSRLAERIFSVLSRQRSPWPPAKPARGGSNDGRNRWQRKGNCSPHIIRQTINVSSIGRRLDTKLHEQMKICVNSMLCLMARPQIRLSNVKTCLDVVNTYAERPPAQPKRCQVVSPTEFPSWDRLSTTPQNRFDRFDSARTLSRHYRGGRRNRAGGQIECF